jgi:hypothetical protein
MPITEKGFIDVAARGGWPALRQTTGLMQHKNDILGCFGHQYARSTKQIGHAMGILRHLDKTRLSL